ncbi:MAG: RNA-binding transcriptional accessory protein [Rhodospirillales bacterium]|nr:RNA-binding transcriptional accessory protein [Rhodospirillales bacterium]
MISIASQIASELGANEAQVAAAVRLLDEGSTVPFIARYRKEATGNLDDTQLRRLEERLHYLRELEDRRTAILKSIEEQGKLTGELERQILEADTKTRLEDLYLPYRPKRRTRAQIAREAGLEPLADALLGDPTRSPEYAALSFVAPDKGVPDPKSALDGARQVLMERFAEDAELLAGLRTWLWDIGIVVAKVAEGRAEAGAKFADYFAYNEPIRAVPSHRAMALFRGRNEGVLQLRLAPPDEVEDGRRPEGAAERRIAARFGISDQGRAADRWLMETVRWTWRVKLHLHLELELMTRLREAAEDEAIRVFARNLRALLLAAPAGGRTTIGLDPGLRTGVKVAVVDATGKLVETAVIHPHPPQNAWDASIAALAGLARRHHAELVAIGNGTASRETDRLAAELIRRHPDLGLTRVVVSEAGASVYSASELAAQEFPNLDVTLRGAASIARRLQDPLAELVKIDPKAIGVGQYQHDVNQAALGRTLDAVVEDCVNAVGVDVNTASVPLLARVAGLTPTIARNVVAHRERQGPYRTRTALLEVERLGAKTFEQAAGFLRVMGGDDPLDASAVHPEAYPVVRRIVAASGREVASLIGDRDFLRSLAPAAFTDDKFGVPTVVDILAELERPGRDPRPQFKTAAFRDGVEEIKDLAPGMVLEGVVTNVTNFGAFVDVGVHQDGLVHVSALANRFVKDPHAVVKAGDVVKVKVLEIDLKRRRIALSMRLDEQAGARAVGGAGRPEARAAKPSKADKPSSGSAGALAEAFARARNRPGGS